MGEQHIPIWFPVNGIVFGVFVGIEILYFAYRGYKFIISMATGTS